MCRLEHPEQDKNKWFFPAENQTFTLSELKIRIDHFSNILKSLSVTKGDRIGLVLSNHSDLVCLIYAAWYLNATVIPIKTQTGKFDRHEEFINRCHQICHFTLLLVEDDIPSIQSRSLTKTTGILAYNLTELKSIRVSGKNAPLNPIIQKDDIAIIQFSSGSTGNPKGVIVTHQMIMLQLEYIELQVLQPISRTKIHCNALWAPLNHDMGMFMGVLFPVYHGTDNILAPPSFYMRNPMRWFQLLAQHNVEVAMFTNSVLAKSLTLLEQKNRNFPLKLDQCRIYLGAEKVSPKLLREAQRVLKKSFGGKFNLFIGYGMAENGLGATTTIPGEIPVIRVSLGEQNKLQIVPADSTHGNEFASVGVPYPNHRITIRNESNLPLPELTLGEIHLESPCLTPGYLNDPKTTRRVLENKCFKTGDLGFMFKGQLFFHSRKDDLIICNGQNIVPDDVEATLEELSFIRSSGSVLFALEDTLNGLQKLICLVETSANISPEEVETRKNKIVRHAFSEMGLIMTGVFLCAKASIEKTSSGKKRRKVIKQRFINNQIEIIQGKTSNEFNTAV